ncbi:MAG: hypothetical protein EOO40_09405, partial [Deltaproteobacteria bacterium]
MASVLQRLQRQLQALHGVDVGLDVDAYTIDDAVRGQIPGAIEGLVEQMFVCEDGGTIEMALFVAPDIVARLQQEGPHVTLRADNLEPFCIALEGVSHFVFVAWRAHLGRPVTALEMELQAEVDKFVCCWLHILQQQADPEMTLGYLMDRLFADFALRAAVPADERDRYRTAHQVA